jgi:hypothetical protein
LYQTPIRRNNISMNCKTYQSSEVDSHSSSNAVNPPYNDGSKTRREADPWYEVDLGKSIHVHSVALTIKGPTQQKVSMSSLLCPLSLLPPDLLSLPCRLISTSFSSKGQLVLRIHSWTGTSPPPLALLLHTHLIALILQCKRDCCLSPCGPASLQCHLEARGD